jgi:hypothetical protein
MTAQKIKATQQVTSAARPPLQAQQLDLWQEFVIDKMYGRQR